MAESSDSRFGSWKSPLSTELIATVSVRLRETRIHDGFVYWTEGRPLEGGRQVICRAGADRSAEDCLPPPFNARTRVHEYGGGAYQIHDTSLYFVDYTDERLYRAPLDGGAPQALTPRAPWRFADFAIDTHRALCWAVSESREKGLHEPEHFLVRIPLTGGAPQVARRGSDFYAAPRLSPDGTRLAWVEWRHPNLPWDATELWVGRLDSRGDLHDVQKIAGHSGESICQPEWSVDGRVLYFVSDRNGWWNLHQWDGQTTKPVLEHPAEFGLPPWVFCQSNYAPLASGAILASYSANGLWHLGRIDPANHTLEPIAVSYTQIDSLRAEKDAAVFLGGAPDRPLSVVRLDLETFSTETVYPLAPEPLGAEFISHPEPIHFPTSEGDTAFALYYPPRNPGYRVRERAPLLVNCHGGPTAAVSSALDLGIQFWTTRGFGVVDVNYRGSTGYGRPYRDRLRGKWGVYDVEDCIQAACFLVTRGDADDRKLAIRGASSGGLTALAAVTFHRFFHAAVAYYGVSDIESLKKETHKFESHYDEWLVGADPAIYRARSPLPHADRVTCPLLLFQGKEDRVVLPTQTQQMYEAVRARGVPVAQLVFEGEQHGFRRAETLVRCLQAELAFYGKILGFEPADELPDLVIENL